jgi:signal transduction histidine kinase
VRESSSETLADLLRSEREARAAAEAAERRATFLARASEVLASTLDCETTLRAVASLSVPVIADWCFIDTLRGGAFRRVAVSHASAGHAALARRLEEEHLLDADASLGPPQVLRSGVSELIPDVTDEFLREVARTPEAYEMLREMDITSVMSVAVRDAESIVGIVTFVSSESRRRFATEDLRLAEDLAVRAGVAMENARLFELIHNEHAAAQRHGRRSAYLARASEVLASSLDHKTTLASVARLAVPDVADWCLVDMVEPDGALRTIALYHSDPSKTATAREIGRRFPYDPKQPCFAPHVVATGEPELATRVPDEILRAGTRNEDHYRALAEFGFRSYMCVPLVVRGRVAGAITFASAESGRSYEPEDLSLAEALAYRAGLAIDNARLYGEAQDAIRVRDEFLSIASHELKTPVTTLQLQIQSLRRRLDSGRMEAGDPGLSKRLAISERQVERLTHLINNLLDITRITAGRMDLRIEEVDFAGVVRDTVARLEEGLARSGCALTLTVSDPQRGEWDKLRLEQIVTNLMSNAMKYGAGRPIEVALSGTPASVRLEVADSGIGIAPENQSRIFGRFERAVSERNYGGLGLGLWIVRQIVDALAGTVTVQSAAGKGSRFAVELPRRRARPGKSATEPSISPAPETPWSGAAQA